MQLSSMSIWLGTTIFTTMERIGETVVDVLGLDESRYQDVLDTMTEEEMQRAKEVQAEREAEYERVKCIKEARQQSQGHLSVMEEGQT